MKYNELDLAKKTSRKRVGRGISSGYGKTAGRGTKGEGARTGKKLAPIFRGGDGEHVMSRLPKLRGFKSKRVPAQVVYADALDSLKGAVTNESLFAAGLISTPFHAVKVIAAKSGDATKFAGSLEVAGASKSVIAAIEKNGGTFAKTAVPLPKSAKSDADAKDAKK